MNIAILSAFGLYIAILFAIGLYFRRRSRTADEYIIGNRSLNYFVTAIAAQSSDMSSWLFLGYPAAVYTFGMNQIWTAVGLVSFMWLSWRYIAPALRRSTEQYNALTLATYFKQRYADHSHILQVGTSLLSIFFFTSYIAAGLVGLGWIFAGAFGVSYHTGILFGIIVTTIYILLGGFFAVAWCNVFQGIFLLAMIIMVPLVGFMQTNVTSILANAAARNINLGLIESPCAVVSAILLSIGWGLGYFGQPHILINFMSINDPKNLKYAERVGITWQILALGAALAVGLVGIGLYPNLDSAQMLFQTMATNLFSPFVVGMALCGVLAATLASINTKLLVSASTASEDLYKSIIAPHAGQIQLTLITRIAVTIVALLSTIVAWNNTLTINELVFYSWSGLGCSFGPLLILSLYTDYINRYGAISAVFCGGLIGMMWPWGEIAPTLVAGFGISIFAAYYITWLSKRRSQTLA